VRALRTLAKAGLLFVPLAAHSALGPRYGGSLNVGVLELPPTVELGVASCAVDRLVLGLTHETLVGISPEGQPLPSLVERWVPQAEGREWRLSLRQDARFHDDQVVTAEDAVRSLRRFLRSPSPAARAFAEAVEGGLPFRNRASEDIGILAIDSRHVVLRLSTPRALPLAPLAAPAAALTSSSGAPSGPFVPTIQVPGRRLGFTSFSSHLRGRPYLQSLQVLAMSDPGALRADFQAGRVDLAFGEPGISTLSSTLILVLDPSQSPFDRPPVRHSVAAALGGDLLGQLVPGADPTPALLLPALLPPLQSFSPSGGPLSGSALMVVATDVPPLVSQRLVAHLLNRGLHVSVKPASPSAARAASAPLRLLLYSPEVPEASLALAELAGLGPEVPTVRQALAAAREELHPDRRRLLLHQAEAALRSQSIIIPLGFLPVSFGAVSRVHGIRVDGSGRLVLEDAWIEP